MLAKWYRGLLDRGGDVALLRSYAVHFFVGATHDVFVFEILPRRLVDGFACFRLHGNFFAGATGCVGVGLLVFDKRGVLCVLADIDGCGVPFIRIHHGLGVDGFGLVGRRGGIAGRHPLLTTGLLYGAFQSHQGCIGANDRSLVVRF